MNPFRVPFGQYREVSRSGVPGENAYALRPRSSAPPCRRPNSQSGGSSALSILLVKSERARNRRKCNRRSANLSCPYTDPATLPAVSFRNTTQRSRFIFSIGLLFQRSSAPPRCSLPVLRRHSPHLGVPTVRHGQFPHAGYSFRYRGREKHAQRIVERYLSSASRHSHPILPQPPAALSSVGHGRLR